MGQNAIQRAYEAFQKGEIERSGVMVHRVMLNPVWYAFNRVARYSLTTTLYWLNFSTQVFRKLKQLHRQSPFHLIQHPSYSFCGLFSIPFLRAAHVVRASSYQPALNDAAGVKRNLDSALNERLEALSMLLMEMERFMKAEKVEDLV